MIRIPIIKIVLATFALFFTQIQKILEVSIFPILISLPFIFAFVEIIPQVKTLEDIQGLQLAPSFLLYALLFFYGMLCLNISLYRLTSLGVQSTHRFGIVPPVLVFRLLPYFFFVQLIIISVSFIQIPFVEPIVFMLIAHILLKFVSISTGLSNISSLQFIDRLNIAILQFIIPIILLMIATIIGSGVLILVIKVLTIYYSAIALGFIFNNLHPHTS